MHKLLKTTLAAKRRDRLTHDKASSTTSVAAEGDERADERGEANNICKDDKQVTFEPNRVEYNLNPETPLKGVNIEVRSLSTEQSADKEGTGQEVLLKRVALLTSNGGVRYDMLPRPGSPRTGDAESRLQRAIQELLETIKLYAEANK